MEKTKNKWYGVDCEGSFYDDMAGVLVAETPTTMVLEFNLVKELGGKQRVQFFKDQLIFDGDY